MNFRASNVVARRLGEGGVLVNVVSNHIFELNGTGMRIWELMTAGETRDAIAARLTEEFDVDAAEAGRAIDRLVADLAKNGLVNP
jgi:hypothetical protein